MDDHDELNTINDNEIRRQIAQGLDSLRLGKGVDGDPVFDRIESELDAIEPQH